jgi:alginate O-acetyltransferase complex protein AlgI
MLFNSYFFLLVFLPVSFLGFYLLARKNWSGANIWLIGTSLFFSAWWNPNPNQPWRPFYLLLILGSCTLNYWSGRLIHELEHLRSKWWLLTVSVTANLLLLVYYKYLGLFSKWSQSLTGFPAEIPWLVLPLAVSFFTFLQITFLVDAYQGKIRDYRFSHYLLFVTFFPHLIAGPIVHHSELMPQFRQQVARIGWRHVLVGLTLLVLGLFKKVVVADRLAAVATPFFELAAHGPRPLSFGEAWTAGLAYSFQIYFDFSGYSDMAIGLAYLFGIRLPLNFNSPYKARSVVEFWQRWHITLSRFLRDYLYIPLGGNRCGKARRYLNLMITMLLGGLWHGAGITYLLWGALHGAYLCINHAWLALRERWHWPALTKPLAVGLTFLAVLLTWIPFRAGAFEVAPGGTSRNAWLVSERIYASLFGGHGFDFWANKHEQIMKTSRALRPLVLALFITWALPNTQEFLGRFSPHFRTHGEPRIIKRPWWRWRPTWYWTIATLVLGYLVGREFDQISEFIYFQF